MIQQRLYCCLSCLNKETIESEFEEGLKDAPDEEILRVLKYNFTPEQIYQILQDAKKSMSTMDFYLRKY